MIFGTIVLNCLAWAVLAQQSVVSVLTDDTFEHLTQAATGATTGDWLVQFTWLSEQKYSPAREVFNQLAPEFSKGRPSVQFCFVDCGGDGHETCTRFKVKSVPAIKFLSHGKVYKYRGNLESSEELSEFASGGWHQIKGKRVPSPPSWLPRNIKKLAAAANEYIPEWLAKVIQVLEICIGLAAIFAGIRMAGVGKGQSIQGDGKGTKQN